MARTEENTSHRTLDYDLITFTLHNVAWSIGPGPSLELTTLYTEGLWLTHYRLLSSLRDYSSGAMEDYKTENNYQVM